MVFFSAMSTFMWYLSLDLLPTTSPILQFNQSGMPCFKKHRPPLGRCFLEVDLSICLSVCLCVCLFIFEVPFKRLFAPTSSSWMIKILRASKSLGKSNGKKWSHIWKLLLMKDVKLPRQKKFVLGGFCKDQEVI